MTARAFKPKDTYKSYNVACKAMARVLGFTLVWEPSGKVQIMHLDKCLYWSYHHYSVVYDWLCRKYEVVTGYPAPKVNED